MLVVPKSIMMSGRFMLEPCAVIADCTDDRVVPTLTPRLVPLEMPVETRVPCESMDDVPRSMTVIWLSPTEAPVETTVAMLVPDETADETAVISDLTEDMPTVVVDSEPEKISQMLFSVETCAWVEPVVVFDWAVDSRVPIDVTDDVRVDREVSPDKAALWATEIELATDCRVEVLTAWLTWLDWVVDSRVETLRSSDKLTDTTLETDVTDDRTAELDVPSEVPADVIAEVETTLLIITTELRNEDTCDDARVAMLVTLETPVERLVSADLLLEIWVCSAETWLAAVDAPVEAAFWLATAVDTPVLAKTSWDRLVEMPTVQVDSEVDSEVKALRPDDTWALVGDAPAATMVEIAVEKITPSDVVDDRAVLREVLPESAVELTTPAEVVVDSAAEVTADSDVWLDLAELSELDSAVSSDSAEETRVVSETCADSSLEIVFDIATSRLSVFDTEVAIVRPAPSTPLSTLVVG